MIAETCDDLAVETIVRGRYTDACRAIGEANLSSILRAEQELSEFRQLAETAGEPHNAVIGLLKLVRGRRRRLQLIAQQQEVQGNRPVPFRA